MKQMVKSKLKTKILHAKSNWYLWLFPVFALLISAWLGYDYYRVRGPHIKISFDDAGGIQPQKTKIRFRGVAIGTVQDVSISPDQKDVVADVILRKDAEEFAVAGSKFSLITPKVGFQGISGLETLFEGAYITVLPGPADGEQKLEFRAQNSMNGTDPLDDTSAYLLNTDNVESVSSGDSVTYRGVKVGQVTKLGFNKGGQTIHVQINVENKYVNLIRDNTVFWRKVGVQAHLGLFGSSIKVNSMDSIMNGGVEFATPPKPGPQAKNLQSFNLSAEAPKDVAKWSPKLD